MWTSLLPQNELKHDSTSKKKKKKKKKSIKTLIFSKEMELMFFL